MLEITKPRFTEERTDHSRGFLYVGERSWGFAFDCDADGNVDVDKLNPDARANWEACLTGTSREGRAVVDTGVESVDRVIRHTAEGRCECGRTVHLVSYFANPCPCGREYNFDGQELAPRSQWGEETGESIQEMALGFCNGDMGDD
jgi:hypothetical protein